MRDLADLGEQPFVVVLVIVNDDSYLLCRGRIHVLVEQVGSRVEELGNFRILPFSPLPRVYSVMVRHNWLLPYFPRTSRLCKILDALLPAELPCPSCRSLSPRAPIERLFRRVLVSRSPLLSLELGLALLDECLHPFGEVLRSTQHAVGIALELQCHLRWCVLARAQHPFVVSSASRGWASSSETRESTAGSSSSGPVTCVISPHWLASFASIRRLRKIMSFASVRMV